MAFMVWSSELELGLELIDTQHHWLVDTTNALYDELSKGEPEAAMVGQLLEGLVDYTMNHFIAEEDLFQRYGYPESEAHHAEHNTFTAHAYDLLARHEKGEKVGIEVLDFLKSWLINHILKSDRAYAPFLLEKGVK